MIVFLCLEVVTIKLSVRSDKKEVMAFIEDLKKILQDTNFDIDRNLKLIKKKKGKEKFSTPYTLLSLDYDAYDVVERLKELTVEEYSETLVDTDDINPPLLFVFGKDINNRQIYVKLKIKEGQDKYVLCVSFHYAEHSMTFPFA